MRVCRALQVATKIRAMKKVVVIAHYPKLHLFNLMET
jgi:hypothetical protein